MNVDLNSVLAILIQFGQLAGVAALIAVVVNVFKYFGLVASGQGGRWFAAANLIALVVLVSFHLFAPTVGLVFIDQQAATIANILLIVLGYVMQLGVGSGTADKLKEMKLPVIGGRKE